MNAYKREHGFYRDLAGRVPTGHEKSCSTMQPPAFSSTARARQQLCAASLPEVGSQRTAPTSGSSKWFDNIFFAADGPVILDWQTTMKSFPGGDMAWFLGVGGLRGSLERVGSSGTGLGRVEPHK